MTNDLIAQLAREVATLRAEIERLKAQEGGAGYLLVTGARAGASAGAQTFSNGVVIAVASTFTGHNPTLIGNSSNGWWAYSYMAGSGGGAQNAFLRAGGSSGSPSAVTNGMSLGSFSFRGHNGSGFTGSKAYISVSATENWSGSANGTNIQFQVTPNGSTTLTFAVMINHDGNVGIASNSPAAQLQVHSTTTSKVAVVARTAASATADALQTQNSAGTVQFAVGPDGKLKTNQAATNTNTPSGATAKQLPVYDTAGTLLGYVPVYGSAW